MSLYPTSRVNGTHPPGQSENSITLPGNTDSPFDPLSAALSSSQVRYTVANPKSLEAHNEACKDFPGGNTRTVLHSSPFPITFVKGEGCELTSLDGEIYIDFLGEFTAGIYGHSNPAIAAAVSEAMRNGWNYGGPNMYERALAKKVTKRFCPSGIELVRFTNSGTEANTMALAAAVAYTGRTKVLAFKNGYHGGTLSFPLTPNRINTNLPHDFILAPYNNIYGTQTILDSLPKDSLAAIIVELIQGSGGTIPGNEDFLHFLNTSANKLGALFIVDEVMTSRLSYHGLSSELGLTPDLVTLGKWVGGGMTFGAFGGRKRVMSMFDPRDGVLAHSGTFNNNVVTMAAGCTGIDLYNEAEVKRLNALGDSLRTGLQAILSTYQINQEQPVAFKPCPQKNELESPFTGTQCSTSTPDTALSVESLSLSDPRNTRSKIAHHSRKGGMWVSGRGSMMNVHFSGESEKSLQSMFWHYMLERGIYLAQRGFVALNIEINESHVEKFLKAAEGFVGMYQGGLGH